ncbi:MAG: mucoidy inhibitor MuiA family protein [Crocinitomix sp.]|nr:mucoidy inhibitor MuiA family protein [Crocinitomix sp.]
MENRIVQHQNKNNTMKQLLIALFLLTSLQLFAYDIRKAKSSVEEVTVFLSGAQITRTGSVSVPKGSSEVIFTGISPLLKRESLQAGTKSNITILSVHYETKLTEKKQDLKELKTFESKRNELSKKVNRYNASMEVIRIQETMIQNLSQIQTQMKDFKVSDIVEAKEIIDANLETIKIRRIDLQEKINTVNVTLNELNQKIQAFGVVYSSIEPQVVVKIRSDREQKVKMKISYFTPNARWYPSYNLRVKDVKSPLTIDYQANISQQTGEDWKNAKITLSTNDPNLGGQKPILKPWYIVLNQYNGRPTNNNKNRYTPNSYPRVTGRVTNQFGEPLRYANIMAIGTTVGTITDGDGHYAMNIPAGSNQLQVNYIGYNPVTFLVSSAEHNIVMQEKRMTLEEVTVIDDMEYYSAGSTAEALSPSINSVDVAYSMSSTESVTMSEYNNKRADRSISKQMVSSVTPSVAVQVQQVENVVSAEFKITERYTIKSDNKQYTVQINEIEHKAHYQYYCAPKLDADVFLTAQLLGWESLNLLEGQASIFFEGTYVGTSLLDAKFVGDTLDISLGRDKRIVVKREKEKEISKKKLVGDNEVKTIKWNIEIKNQKSQQINLIVEDQFPLTNDAKIKIDKDDINKARIDETTGFITWKLKIGASKIEKLAFKYKVTYPKGNEVYLD